MEISLHKTGILKGVVISMMVWLHLFNNNHTELCTNLLCFWGEPFAKWLSGACGPVGFFLLFSGYGQAYTYGHKGLNYGQQSKRLLKLYTHWWLVLLLFLPLAICLRSDHYPGTLKNVVLNMIGWEYGYNGEMWFLFPYCMVSLVSPLLLRWMDKMGENLSVVITAGIHIFTCFIISRYGAQLLYNNMMVYQPFLFFHFLYYFSIGAYMYRMKWEVSIPQWLALILIVIAVSTMATFSNSVLTMVYVPVLTILICNVNFPVSLDRVLTELGHKSMVMWMTHTWLCYYLFQSQVYSLRYPILIWGVILASYLIAIPIMWCARKIFAAVKILEYKKTE